MDLSFEEAYAAIGRALDAFCEEGDCPLTELPQFPPLYGLRLGHRLMQEEQKIPPALKDLLSVVLDGVSWTAEDGGGELPHRHVKELQAALTQGGKFLGDLTEFRLSALSMEPLSGDALMELESRQPLLPSLGGLPEARKGQVRQDMEAAAREELERMEAAAALDDDLEELERVPVEPPQWVKDGLAHADAKLAELAQEVTDEEYAAENSVPINGPGRYVHLDNSASMSPVVKDMAARVVRVLVAAGELGLAARQAQAEREGDTAELEAVAQESPYAQMGTYVTLIDGASTVSRATVIGEAQSRPVEKLQRGDVIPGGGDFFLVESAELMTVDGSRQVHVTYTNGKSRKWFPGTTVAAYRP